MNQLHCKTRKDTHNTQFMLYAYNLSCQRNQIRYGSRHWNEERGRI